VVTAADAQRLRQAQDGLQALAQRDLLAIWATLDLSSPERARDELIELTTQLVRSYGRVGADVAADWYDIVRADAAAAGRFRAEPVLLDQAEQIDRTVRRAAGALFTDSPAGVLTALKGPIGKYTVAPARATIVQATWADPAASGWARVTRAGSCGFCRMLAQRGAVYRKDTATFASHSHCNCAAVPSFDPDAPEVDARAYTASRRMSDVKLRAAAGDANAARVLQEHRDRVRAYVDAYVD
jgi:hypothetical protein